VRIDGVPQRDVPEYLCNPFFVPKVVSLTDNDAKTALQLATESKNVKISELIRSEMQRAIDVMTVAIEKHRDDVFMYYENRG
jgi:hypothetical protein